MKQSKRNSPEAIAKRKLSEIRHGRHCVFLMHVHLVFVTKYRKVCFSKRVLTQLNSIFQSVCLDFNAELVEFNGEGDHVHLLINYPPQIAISKIVNSLKGVSSRMIRKEKYPEIQKKLWGDSLWTSSYFAGSCGGAALEIVKQYIEQQESPQR